jgi:hypothetical protein
MVSNLGHSHFIEVLENALGNLSGINGRGKENAMSISKDVKKDEYSDISNRFSVLAFGESLLEEIEVENNQMAVSTRLTFFKMDHLTFIYRRKTLLKWKIKSPVSMMLKMIGTSLKLRYSWHTVSLSISRTFGTSSKRLGFHI